MPRYKSEKATTPYETEQKLIQGNHISMQEKGDSPDTRILSEPSVYITPVRVGSMACQIYYRSKAPAFKTSRLTEVRHYFAGLIEVAVAQIGPDGFRLSIADSETPIRVRDFKNEREAHTFLTDALTQRSPE